MKKEYRKGSRFIGGFWSGVFHDDYESPPGVLNLRQELFQGEDGCFYLRQVWPYDFPEGRVTTEPVSMAELPFVLSMCDDFGEKARDLQINVILSLIMDGYDISKIADILHTTQAAIRSRMPLLKGILVGDISVLNI